MKSHEALKPLMDELSKRYTKPYEDRRQTAKERMGHIVLPLPPSANQLHIRRKGGGVALSARYQKWIADCTFLVRADETLTRLPPKAEYKTSIICPAKMRMDLDNVAKPVHDLLTAAGLTGDDRLLQCCCLMRGSETDSPNQIRVFYEPFGAAAKRIANETLKGRGKGE